jgi:hypothetical protein
MSRKRSRVTAPEKDYSVANAALAHERARLLAAPETLNAIPVSAVMPAWWREFGQESNPIELRCLQLGTAIDGLRDGRPLHPVEFLLIVRTLEGPAPGLCAGLSPPPGAYVRVDPAHAKPLADYLETIQAALRSQAGMPEGRKRGRPSVPAVRYATEEIAYDIAHFDQLRASGYGNVPADTVVIDRAIDRWFPEDRNSLELFEKRQRALKSALKALRMQINHRPSA